MSNLNQPRRLKTLLADWATAVATATAAGPHLPPPAYDGPDIPLTNIVEHTADVVDGSCFVARVRTGSDGHPYIGQAIARGARAIIAQRPSSDLNLTLPDDVAYLHVADTAEASAWLAAAWYDFPGRDLTLIGITGTDGKSSTANLLLPILQAAGLQTGLLSTIRAVIGDAEEPLALHVTTPEAPVVQRYLRRMVDAGLTHCILEVTSHSLAQHRVTGTDFDIAVITNVGHEHHDYHGGPEQYLAAKARLFEMLSEASDGSTDALAKTAVLNLDDDSFTPLAAIPVPRQIVYTIRRAHEIDGWITPAVAGQGRLGLYALDIRYAADKTRFILHLPAIAARLYRPGVPWLHPPHRIPIETPLVGEFNVYNMLAAAAAAYALPEEISPEQIKEGLEAVRIISGRMERIDAGQPFPVIVDFAHTPNALVKAIEAARGMTNGRIITVFGSAGKRDVEKRRLMAEISAREADITVLTAEDPRTESLDDILAFMAAGCRREGGIEGETFWRIPDRGRAIYHALTLAGPEDLVLICGKGHEQSMCFGTTEYPWDDRQATRDALDAWLNGRPVPNLGLPTFPGAFGERGVDGDVKRET